jgi:alkanesulfonate monooxygenase SsuD/methylene tetrahydromethanopterin reductase-like flavin-dependent oxidoreductase (luciferase family)
MDFGVWHDFRNPPPWHRPWDAVYRENLDQIAYAEELGYESVWLSEHHVTEDGYLPSVFPLLAAVAVRTRRMRLGTAVLLAPFQHPIRFAEDAAFVDQLSGGRLELGLGLAYRLEEFEALGVPRARRAELTEQLVAEARRAWTGTSGHSVAPPPFQVPEPPLWLGGANDTAARRAARLRCHFMPDALIPASTVATYRETLRSQGDDPDAFRITVNPAIYVCSDPERGWVEVRDHFLYQFNRYAEWGGRAGLERADDLPRDRYIVGTPEDVVRALGEIVGRTSCDRLIFWARPPGLAIERATESLELFARQVAPAVASL